MFENLKAAKAVGVTLSGMKGPSAESGHRAWAADILFYGAKVGSASGSDIKREINLIIDDALMQQMVDVLKAGGFKIDATKQTKRSSTTDTARGYMSLAVAQIADEMDLVKELKAAARTQTLVLLRSAPAKATVFGERFTPDVKARLSAKYGDDIIEFVNESLKGL
ncbi:hypothetical protein [Pseudomonas baetica]|uniref:hypothetical protein n=1 Tax=Pseudomonas baetica TaxID=674054 RepID=UPI0024067364|nr:hypothetical protein [Pseudomonas baetica]MDF9779064.1 hypothetical protein [Pseudomonas baetica]